MQIEYEAKCRAIWHTDCPKNKWNSGVMRVLSDEPAEDRSVVECLHCGKKAYLPYGSIGLTTVEEVADMDLLVEGIKARLKNEQDESVVRQNLMTRPWYTPYCGAMCVMMPRTKFDGEQFKCPDCGWRSAYPPEVIHEYKARQAVLTSPRIPE